MRLPRLAEQLRADLVLVGSRGLSGTQAVLDSVSDMVVHYATRPVLSSHTRCWQVSTRRFLTGR